ncbi:MAG: glycosyltransferase family 4 protein [Candidatus Omnitrophota bacterium]
MLIQLVLVMLSSFALAFLLMPFFIRFAYRFNLLDRPRGRKIHTRAVPTLGGIVIYLAFTLGLMLAFKMNPAFRQEFASYLVSLLIGSVAILVLGALHDTVDIQPVAKLMGQIIAALIIFIHGIRIEVITNPFGGILYLPQEISLLLTVAWMVAVMNAINLIDGLDGLAGGITVIGSTALLCIAFLKHDISSMFITIALIGSILGFLRYNFHPAKVFMGDTGSMFLGFILGVISIQGINKMATTVALLVPITAMGIPIYDTFLAIIRRLVTHKNMLHPDRKHLHYRLLGMGINQRKVVLFLYAVAVYFGLVAFLLVLLPIEFAFMLLLLLGLGVFVGMKAIGFMESRLRSLPR